MSRLGSPVNPASPAFLANAQAYEKLRADIKAAHAAAMTPLMVPDMKQPSPAVAKLAYEVLSSLDDVTPILERLSAHK